jgi:hypothetical protein
VQECQALGKQIVVSNLEVHKEHQYGVFFDRQSAQDLADKMGALLTEALPGPELTKEAMARQQAVCLAKIYAKQFCDLVEDAQFICNKVLIEDVGAKRRQGLAIATSLRPKGNIQEQQKVVASWLELGFTVYSVNQAEDISRMAVRFPKVKFREAAHGEPGKGHITDILTCLYKAHSEVCGIASPYTYLFGNIDGQSLSEAKDSIFYVQTKKLECTAAHIKDGEYTDSVIFLHKDQIGACPVCDLYLEEPWWYLWLLLACLSKRYALKRADFLLAYELAGNETSTIANTLEQGKKVAAHLPPPFTLEEIMLPKYHQILWKVAEKNTLKTKDGSQV